MSAEPKTELRAAFHQMKNGTKEDWQIIGSHHAELCNGVADRVAVVPTPATHSIWTVLKAGETVYQTL